MGFWQENKTAISIILGSALIAGALYLGLTGKKLPLPINQGQVSPSPALHPTETADQLISPSPQLYPTNTPTTTPPLEITYRKSDIITALSQKTGIPEGEINYSVGDEIKGQSKILLQGAVSRQGEMGGAAFFAVVDRNGVKVTFTGQGVPKCSEVNPYGYPSSWADYCLDENGDTVAR